MHSIEQEIEDARRESAAQRVRRRHRLKVGAIAASVVLNVTAMAVLFYMVIDLRERLGDSTAIRAPYSFLDEPATRRDLDDLQRQIENLRSCLSGVSFIGC